jgi:hypothetical protein
MKKGAKYPSLELLMWWGIIASLKILCIYSKNNLLRYFWK